MFNAKITESLGANLSNVHLNAKITESLVANLLNVYAFGIKS